MDVDNRMPKHWTMLDHVGAGLAAVAKLPDFAAVKDHHGTSLQSSEAAEDC